MKVPLFSLVVVAGLLDAVIAGGYISFQLNSVKSSERQVTIISPSHIKSTGGILKGLDQVTVPLRNGMVDYVASFSLGTPPQQFTAAIDTGSSDLWVIASNDPWCQGSSNTTFNPKIDCSSAGGLFNFQSSSTYKVVSNDFSIRYLDKTYAEGPWATDNIVIGGVTATDFQFGVGLVANSSTGVFGIALTTDESTYNGTTASEYDNFPVVLKRDGITDSVSYSLWLNDVEADAGTLLFGAVDHSRYTGELFQVPLYNYFQGRHFRTTGLPVGQIELTVSVDKVEVNTACGSREEVQGPFTGLLDSGTTLTLLPEDAAEKVIKAYNATLTPLSDTDEEWTIKCKEGDNTEKYLVYYFSGVPVKVDLRQTFLHLTLNDGSTWLDSDGDELCVFGFDTYPSDPSDPNDYGILGDTFLRSAYVVFDLEAKNVALAQASYSDDASDIEVIQSGAIPSAVAASAVSSTIATSACSSTSSTTASSSISSIVTSTYSNNVTTASSSGSTPGESSYITTILSTSVSGTLTVVDTIVSTVCPKCTNGVSPAKAPVTAVSDAEILTVIDGTTVTIPCHHCTEKATAAVSAATATGSSIVTVISGKTVTVPCSETSTVELCSHQQSPVESSTAAVSTVAGVSVKSSSAVGTVSWSIPPVSPENVGGESSVAVIGGSTANIVPHFAILAIALSGIFFL